ncbi:MAG TPA: GAP family protein [Mycobacterium sp.]|nr:GAP family protein [Mycobacterium sp.]HQC76308.1 GAP family protein [Mycobacterium sp.]
MWTTVMLLAIAVNFEPTRIGLLPLLLSRDRPLLQLAAYLLGSMTISLGFGFLVLFVFHRNPFGTSASNGGKAQIVVGILAILVAAAMVLKAVKARRATGPKDSDTRFDKFTQSVRNVLSKGRSPWLACLIGVGVGLPSVDYLAVLMIIATSGAAPTQQAAVLVTAGIVGSLIIIAPLIGYLVAPAKTLDAIARFGAWTRSRSQYEYAALLAFAGAMLVGIGVSHL